MIVTFVNTYTTGPSSSILPEVNPYPSVVYTPPDLPPSRLVFGTNPPPPFGFPPRPPESPCRPPKPLYGYLPRPSGPPRPLCRPPGPPSSPPRPSAPPRPLGLPPLY